MSVLVSYTTFSSLASRCPFIARQGRGKAFLLSRAVKRVSVLWEQYSQCWCLSHRCFLLVLQFLHRWGSFTCHSLVGHAFSSHLGFLPSPLVSGSFPSKVSSPVQGVSLAGLLLKRIKSAPFLESHIRPQDSRALRVPAAPEAAFSPLLSSQELVTYRLSLDCWESDTRSQVPQTAHDASSSPNGPLEVPPLIWHEVQREHPPPLPSLGRREKSSILFYSLEVAAKLILPRVELVLPNFTIS